MSVLTNIHTHPTFSLSCHFQNETSLSPSFLAGRWLKLCDGWYAELMASFQFGALGQVGQEVSPQLQHRDAEIVVPWEALLLDVLA